MIPLMDIKKCSVVLHDLNWCWFQMENKKWNNRLKSLCQYSNSLSIFALEVSDNEQFDCSWCRWWWYCCGSSLHSNIQQRFSVQIYSSSNHIATIILIIIFLLSTHPSLGINAFLPWFPISMITLAVIINHILVLEMFLEELKLHIGKHLLTDSPWFSS